MKKKGMPITSISLVLLLLLVSPCSMWADETIDESSDRLVITVVEDIPAMEIEDGQIPLAAGPGFVSGPEAVSGYRHAVLSGILLTSVIACSIYFDMCEKQLFLLKMQAAKAQQAAEKARRTLEMEGRLP